MWRQLITLGYWWILWVDLVNVITDINIAIESGEFDTIVIISNSPLRVLNILLLFFL
jgi:hypothetical protein